MVAGLVFCDEKGGGGGVSLFSFFLFMERFEV